jgi:hypothetical protein
MDGFAETLKRVSEAERIAFQIFVNMPLINDTPMPIT